ncbi:hypothetical protein [Planobispora takensis]|uniref:hypothetical protein n=1 Tax=Planobispora takensis TaxID=1367882 RepID=UPI0019451561|nr:hypothetical protein [Planobispora takensis]
MRLLAVRLLLLLAVGRKLLAVRRLLLAVGLVRLLPGTGGRLSRPTRGLLALRFLRR